MTVQQSRRGGGYLERPAPSGLVDVIEIILDKGLVIDAYIRVALVGIELLTIDARIVIASVDTYLRFAEATNRLDLLQHASGENLPELIHDLQQGGSSRKTSGAIQGVKKALGGGGDDEDEDEDDGERRRPRKKATSSRRRSSSQ